MAAYLTKPVSETDLRAALQMLLNPQQQRVAPPTMAPPPSPDERRRSLRILLAEDNVVNQKVATRLLEKQGHTVVVVGNGYEVLDALAQQDFNLVLMDVQMPEMNGLEATEAIRMHEQQHGKHLPIIALTAHAMQGDRDICLAAGMDDYLVKPMQAADLYAAIDRLLPEPATA